MKTATPDQEFIPFGPQWEKQMMKLSKKDLVFFLKKTCKENLELLHHKKQAINN